MTEIFTEEAPELIGVGAEALIQNATRLGLTWVLRYGTVTTSDPLTVTVDSDTIPVAMVSLIGRLAPDSRVSVLIVSSKVHFVVGFPPGESRRMNLIDLQIATADANLTLGSSPQDISGTTITLELPDCTYDAEGTFDVQVTSAGTSVFSGILEIDGVAETSAAIWGFTTAEGLVRNTVSQVWSGSLTAGSHTFLLQGDLTVASGISRVNATHTRLLVRLWG